MAKELSRGTINTYLVKKLWESVKIGMLPCAALLVFYFIAAFFKIGRIEQGVILWAIILIGVFSIILAGVPKKTFNNDGKNRLAVGALILFFIIPACWYTTLRFAFPFDWGVLTEGEVLGRMLLGAYRLSLAGVLGITLLAIWKRPRSRGSVLVATCSVATITFLVLVDRTLGRINTLSEYYSMIDRTIVIFIALIIFSVFGTLMPNRIRGLSKWKHN